MKLTEWYAYRSSEGYTKMGKPSRDKRKSERKESAMAGKTAKVYTGVWDNVSGAEMKNNGEPLGAALIAATTTYRANPTPETRKTMTDADEKFNRWWGPFYARMKDTEEESAKVKPARK